MEKIDFGRFAFRQKGLTSSDVEIFLDGKPLNSVMKMTLICRAQRPTKLLLELLPEQIDIDIDGTKEEIE